MKRNIKKAQNFGNNIYRLSEMEEITVNWGPSVESGSDTFTFEDLNMKSIEEWNELSEDEQRDKLQDAIDGLPERVCIIVDDWKLK